MNSGVSCMWSAWHTAYHSIRLRKPSSACHSTAYEVDIDQTALQCFYIQWCTVGNTLYQCNITAEQQHASWHEPNVSQSGWPKRAQYATMHNLNAEYQQRLPSMLFFRTWTVSSMCCITDWCCLTYRDTMHQTPRGQISSTTSLWCKQNLGYTWNWFVSHAHIQLPSTPDKHTYVRKHPAFWSFGNTD